MRTIYPEHKSLGQLKRESRQMEREEKNRWKEKAKREGKEVVRIVTWQDGEEQVRYELRTGLNSVCFVATAVYGEVDAPQVQALRNFRDNVLMQSEIGRKFIGFYYGGVGERTARIISRHLPSTIPLLRKGLDYIANKYSGGFKNLD